MQSGVLNQVVLPIALFLIMFGMGLTLKLADFRRVFSFPKAAAIGIVCQMILLPLCGLAVIKLFGMTGALAVGLMILALCPGGVTSNMYAFLARGDVALSITLTAIVSLLAPFTVPFLLQWSMASLINTSGQESISIPIGKTIAQLVVITVIPVGLGMLVNKRKPALAASSQKPVKIFSIVFLFAIIAAIVKREWANLPDWFTQVGLSTLTLNVATMALGFGIAVLARLNRRQSISIGLEVGIQNGTTALLVAGIAADATGVPFSRLSIAPAIYSLLMFATGALFAMVVGRRTSS